MGHKESEKGQPQSITPSHRFKAGDWDGTKVTVFDGKRITIFPSLMSWMEGEKEPHDLYIEKQSLESYKVELRNDVLLAAAANGHRLRGLNGKYTFKGRTGKKSDKQDAKAIYRRVQGGAYGRILTLTDTRREWYRALDQQIIEARRTGKTKSDSKNATAALREVWGKEKSWSPIVNKCLSGVTLRATLWWVSQYATSRDEFDRLIGLQEHPHHGIIRSNIVFHKFRKHVSKAGISRTEFRRILRSAYHVLQGAGDRANRNPQRASYNPSPAPVGVS